MSRKYARMPALRVHSNANGSKRVHKTLITRLDFKSWRSQGHSSCEPQRLKVGVVSYSRSRVDAPVVLAPLRGSGFRRVPTPGLYQLQIHGLIYLAGELE